MMALSWPAPGKTIDAFDTSWFPRSNEPGRAMSDASSCVSSDKYVLTIMLLVIGASPLFLMVNVSLTSPPGLVAFGLTLEAVKIRSGNLGLIDPTTLLNPALVE